MVFPKHLLAISLLIGGAVCANTAFASTEAAEECVSFTNATKTKLVANPNDERRQNGFGSSVLLTDTHSIVGAPATQNNKGVVYIFNNETGAQTTVTTDGLSGSLFGVSLAEDDDILVVGAPAENIDSRTVSSGAVYVFHRVKENWVLKQRLVANDAMSGDFFGASVAVEDDNLFVGAYLQDGKGIDSGAVYYFVKQASGQFVQRSKLLPASLKAGALFGNALALDDNTLAISAYGYDGTSPGGGAVYMYEKINGEWQPQVKLEAAKRKAFSEFGWSISLDDNTLAVSAPYEDESGKPSGAVYIFDHAKDGWKYNTKIRYSDEKWQKRFAATVAIEDKNLLVGAPYGVGYLFQRIDGKWQQREKLIGELPHNDILYSRAVALEDNTALLGVPSNANSRLGSAYLFKGEFKELENAD